MEAEMPYMSWTLENCKISQYQTSADRFDFQPQLTTEPTAPEAGGKGYVLTSIQHSATDTSLLDQPNTEASSRLFVGNLTMNSEASVPEIGFDGGVRVASGDVNEATMDRIENLGIVLESDVSQTGDDGKPDLLVANVGSDWTLTPDTVTPGPDDGLDSPAVQKGTWIMDATFQDGTTVAMEPVILEGHQCLVFFLG
jgi:hypothetical protein